MIIDKPYIIDRETVKQLLQITGTTQDALIDIYLPIVSEDVELICNQSFVCEYKGTLTSGSTIITDINLSRVSKGWLVSTSQYVQELVTDADLNANTLTITETAPATEEGATVLINVFPVAKRVVASQMIAFQINKNSGITSVDKVGLKSKSIGQVSVSFSDEDSSLSSGYGYPNYMVSSLMQIRKPKFV